MIALKNSTIVICQGAHNDKKKSILKEMKKHKLIYFLMMPGLIYYFIFHYLPMFGIIIAFKDIAPFEGVKGILTGEWVGLKHFRNFFNSYYFWNVLGNTVTISIYKLIFAFPAPIILALLLNEINNTTYKKIVQTI